jgi:polar amino acid transport system substrate-binding protein
MSMRGRLRFIGLGLLLAVPGMLVGSGARAASTVHLVTDPEKEGGFLVAITQRAFERAGYTVSISYMPWVRALQMVLNGDAEALLGAYHTPERAQRLLYTEPIGSAELVFFALKDSGIRYQSLEDLRPYRIGTISGARYTPEFDAADFLMKEAVSDYVLNLRKLLAGRVHVMVEKRSVVEHALAARFASQASRVVALDKPLTSAQFFNAFSRAMPGHERKVADFNAGLKSIAADGTLAGIMALRLHE